MTCSMLVRRESNCESVTYVVLGLGLIRWHAFVLIANAAYAVVALVMTALATRNAGCVEVLLQLSL